MTKKRVAVIGAGPGGAIATDALAKEDAFETIRVFDRNNRAGGTWVFTPGPTGSIPSLRALLEQRADLPVNIPSALPCKTAKAEEINSPQLRYSDAGVHENLHSNLPPEIMSFTQEPIPSVVSERTMAQYGPDAPFRHREVVREWIEGIFTRGKYESLVEFDTTVELAIKDGDEWVLTLRKSELGTSENIWWQERFDSLVVASGHYYLPYVPNIPGLIDFEEKFPGTIRHSKHYPLMEEMKGKRVIVVGGSVSAFDALHDIRLVSRGQVISSLRTVNPSFGPTPFTHPDIINKPEISAFDSETGRITFSDGSSFDDVDIVLFATGYDFSFPFLPDVKPINGRIPGLYQHVFKISDPSLAFIGMVTGGFGIRIFEWQAVAAARVLSGHATLPSRGDMEKWEQERIAKEGDGPAFWALSPDFSEHFEDLRNVAGEPTPGTSGRVLPKYDSSWADSFWKFVDYRVERWKNMAAEAEANPKLAVVS